MAYSYKIKQEYVYKQFEFNMSTKKMAAIMFAGVSCGAAFTTLWTLSPGRTRDQSSRDTAHAIVHLHPDHIEMFETLSGVVLKEPQQVQLNAG